MRASEPAFAGIRSDIPAIAWPPVSHGKSAAMAAMARQFDATQWLTREEIAIRQFRQLAPLATHCEKYSPHFRRRLEDAGLAPQDLLSADGLRRLPILTRRAVQAAGDGFYCSEVPDGHLPLTVMHTSGSTGEPVLVRRTAIGNFDTFAYTLREQLWHRYDLSKPVCVIRAHVGELIRSNDWGPPAQMLFDTGPLLAIPMQTDIERQIELIAEFQPDSLLLCPSNLVGIARSCARRGIAFPFLRHIRTIGETVTAQLRAEVGEVFAARIVDAYSSEEVGCIACECPESPLYHVMETILVEIVDAGGAPCAAGEIGRVVVTDLRNFATPLIRYDMGDYAEASAPCPCGRGLATLARVLGRERNLIVMPDGTRFWPRFGGHRFRDHAPVHQYQVLQHDRERLELRLVMDAPLTPQQETAILALIRSRLRYPFRVDISYFEKEIPKGANGKFEEFICLLKTPPGP